MATLPFNLLLLLHVSFLPLLLIGIPAALSQEPASSSPAVASCQPRLLSLAPCAPFVQGAALSPSEPCCDNLGQIYTQQPNCLCLLLNDTSLVPLPINGTRVLELPQLCSLQADASSCSGAPASPSAPGPQVSVGARRTNNSTVAASPVVEVTPRPSIIRSGPGLSSGTMLDWEGRPTFLVGSAVAILLLAQVFY
ncbi:non-specific lipid transfer protein GPI-anchored 10 isoform X2 [Rhodamnia argentea]|uniref:Non-specific lipid transfer protein GPI-anchored 10 isoform X2 n=1 Tax=Rhodamnia argentea TaxID=178133 RepID=A0A8B8PLH1_9MYRT|nr:non-specific lipid transfer protein GPI-anchored 10 isoform X2 [Rhodamnia argentea]